MEPFIGQLVLFAGNFAPRGWALCEGQLLAISANNALFSILGTTYGGDGRTTFALPDLRGRTPIGPGSGPGLSAIRLGQTGGNESTTLQVSNLPPAQISIPASDDDSTTTEPINAVCALPESDDKIYAANPTGSMKAGSIIGAANTAFSNRAPFSGVNYIIALVGTYPSRS